MSRSITRYLLEGESQTGGTSLETKKKFLGTIISGLKNGRWKSPFTPIRPPVNPNPTPTPSVPPKSN